MKRHSTWRTTAVTNSLPGVFVVLHRFMRPCCAEKWHDRPMVIQAALSYIPAQTAIPGGRSGGRSRSLGTPA